MYVDTPMEPPVGAHEVHPVKLLLITHASYIGLNQLMNDHYDQVHTVGLDPWVTNCTRSVQHCVPLTLLSEVFLVGWWELHSFL